MVTVVADKCRFCRVEHGKIGTAYPNVPKAAVGMLGVPDVRRNTNDRGIVKRKSHSVDLSLTVALKIGNNFPRFVVMVPVSKLQCGFSGV